LSDLVGTTWPEVALRAIRLVEKILEPGINYLWGLALIYALIRITDASVRSTIKGIVAEFAAFVGEGSTLRALRILNAFGGILLLALAVFLYFTGLAHIKLPDTALHTSEVTQAIYVAVLFFFGLYFIVSVWLTKTLKS